MSDKKGCMIIISTFNPPLATTLLVLLRLPHTLFLVTLLLHIDPALVIVFIIGSSLSSQARAWRRSNRSVGITGGQPPWLLGLSPELGCARSKS